MLKRIQKLIEKLDKWLDDKFIKQAEEISKKKCQKHKDEWNLYGTPYHLHTHVIKCHECGREWVPTEEEFKFVSKKMRERTCGNCNCG